MRPLFWRSIPEVVLVHSAGLTPPSCAYSLAASAVCSQLTAEPSTNAPPPAGGITWLQVTAARRVPVSPGGVPAPVLSDDELEAPQAALAPYTTGLRDADPPPVQELTSCRLEVMVPSPPLLNLPPRSTRSGPKHPPGLAAYLNYFYSNIDGLERKISTMTRRP